MVPFIIVVRAWVIVWVEFKVIAFEVVARHHRPPLGHHQLPLHCRSLHLNQWLNRLVLRNLSLLRRYPYLFRFL